MTNAGYNGKIVSEAGNLPASLNGFESVEKRLGAIALAATVVCIGFQIKSNFTFSASIDESSRYNRYCGGGDRGPCKDNLSIGRIGSNCSLRVYTGQVFSSNYRSSNVQLLS